MRSGEAKIASAVLARMLDRTSMFRPPMGLFL